MESVQSDGWKKKMGIKSGYALNFSKVTDIERQPRVAGITNVLVEAW
jgi:hypothetical protein